MSPGRWGVAEAKQRLSEVLRAARSAPQVIVSRREPVAAVVSVELLRAVQTAQAAPQRSLAERFAELRALCAETGYTLRIPRRHDRSIETLG